MSMLAERKRKTKYVINPTKKPLWTTDSDGIKFGKGLMEKMGWSAGKGLGANEQGIQEPLRVTYKNDSKGMGFKGNEENWIEYQDEFNSLLNQLANNSDNSVKAKEAEKSEVMSLEEKSKLSKARVHYQKFTRGKDLSKYSEKDLSCILGTSKKKKRDDEKAAEEETPHNNNNNTYDTSFGVTTIYSGSLTDYFKQKWTDKSLKSENSNLEQFSSGFDEKYQFNEKVNGVVEKKSKKKHKENNEEFLGNENVEKEVKKHKKKRKKLDVEEEIPSKKEKKLDTYENDAQTEKDEECQPGTVSSPTAISNDCIEDVLRSKKKKKKKKESKESEELIKVESVEHNDLIEESVEKKTKIKRRKIEVEEKCGVESEEGKNGNAMEENLQKEVSEMNITKKKKKKEKRKKELCIDNSWEELVNEDKVTVVEKTSKKKKEDAELDEHKSHDEEQSDSKSQLEGDEEQACKKKKKKKEKGAENLREVFKNADEYSVKEELQNAFVIKEEKKKKKKVSEEKIEEQTSGGDVRLNQINHINEEISVKKKKKSKHLKEVETDEQISKEFSGAEASTPKNREKKRSREEAEAQAQSEEIRKKTEKHKKEEREEKTEEEGDKSESETLDSERKRVKKKKNEIISETDHTSETFKGKEKKDGEADCKGESEKTLIHTHKTTLFQMKKPFLDGFKKCSTSKALNLICGAEIEKFKGSNLAKIPGYGFRKKTKSDEEKR